MSGTTSPYALTQSLNLLADTYNYNHWVYSLMRPYLGRAICEVGAGIGNMTRFFLDADRLVCVEPDLQYAALLRNLADIHSNMTVFEGTLERYASDEPKSRGWADTVVCTNILEHIEDDGTALTQMGGIMKDEGVILLFVPACSWALGSMDTALGHYRRYSIGMLRRLARENGFQIIVRRYVNLIGLAGWWWSGCVRRETTICPRKARLMDRMVPYVSAAERLLPPVVGQSLFAVMKRSA